MTNEAIYKKYKEEICSKCKNQNNCEEELHIRLDKTVRCDNYKK